MKSVAKLLIPLCVFGCSSILRVEVLADELNAWIDRAGNSESDEDRFDILSELLSTELVSGRERKNLEKLMETIAAWNEGEDLDWWSRELRDKGSYDFGFGEESLFHPIAQIYETRMWVWAILEYGFWWSLPEIRREKFDFVRPKIEALVERFPQNRILRMYLGEPYLNDHVFSPAPGLPAWAVYQREAIERQREMIHWWIDNRMRPNGEYGGGWGDDCEMWRVWMPLLVGFEDPKIVTAQKRFSSALLAQPHMEGGYTSLMSDVEHTAEDTSDTLTPMMLIEPEDEEWKNRALRLAELMESLWTGVNRRGLRQFKSTYFTADEIELEDRKAVASVYETRAIQPALLYWQRSADPELGKLFLSWLDGWVDASLREERGKPRGIIPSAVHWPDGTVGGTGANWWKPENYTDNPLYVWPSAMRLMSQSLALGWHMTQQDSYLEPLFAMAEARMDWMANPVDRPAPGSRAWCGQNMKGLVEGLVKYRFLSGDARFDGMIQNDAGPYVRFRLFGDREGLDSALRNHAESLRYDFPGYTSEVRYTDRIARFPRLFTEASMYPKRIEGRYEPDMQMLFSCLTGEPGTGMVFPLNAVRWRIEPVDFAALVVDSSRTRFEAEICNFSRNARRVPAEFYLLEEGGYSVRLEHVDTGERMLTVEMKVGQSSKTLPLTLPPLSHCRIVIEKR